RLCARPRAWSPLPSTRDQREPRALPPARGGSGSLRHGDHAPDRRGAGGHGAILSHARLSCALCERLGLSGAARDGDPPAGVLAAGLETNAADFSPAGAATATLTSLASAVRDFAKLFEEPGVQELNRQKGLSAKPELLGPRKPGAIIAAAPLAVGRSTMPFSGSYRGK